MKMGEIIQVGIPDEVYNDCENMFIADFIGTPPASFLFQRLGFCLCYSKR